MNRLLNLTTVFILTWGIGRTQSFDFRAGIPPVTQPGYYRILLPPPVVGRLNAAKTDIRLYDDQNREIPYLLTQKQPGEHVQFREYELVGKTTTSVSTQLVLRNGNKTPINSLGLILKNTNLRKKARLSGSNDGKTWYGIEDDYLLEPVSNNQATSEAKILGFPLSDYEYYQLEINDSLSAPLNILKVGYYTTTSEAGNYSDIPGISFTQRDSSDHKSYVHITFPTPSRPDKLIISVQSPDQYRRSAELGQFRIQKQKRNRRHRFFETLRSFELHSMDSLHTVLLPNQPTHDLFLIIENQNNVPLTLGSIKAQQLTTELLAELKPGESYHLAFANPAVGAPTYDLVHFKTKIPTNPPVIQVHQPVSVHVSSGSSPSIFTSNPWLIWLAIGLVVAMLSYFSYQMVTDMKNR
ncbi:hypothetical protein [Larkinella humicola]|uniref:DUF3999 domain-containing protein n=1 Tax=Larkinella humicola TaxID=2607654 RepID=A0A5N1J9F4_9BACT|nr:hypothetical protein [Larkinella humicola]KAA9349282.1 hypothetical protein F0P93_23085 [Larkinella humicola]